MQTSAPLFSVRALISPAGLPFVKSMTWAAPSDAASSNRFGMPSTAITVPPLRRASWVAIRPGTPRPKTATYSPRWTSASSTALSAIAPILEKIPTTGSRFGGDFLWVAQLPWTTVVLLCPHVPQTTSPGRTSDSERESVDEYIGIVALVKIGFAADRRHADAVAVASDPGDNPRNQIARARVVDAPETKGIQ